MNLLLTIALTILQFVPSGDLGERIARNFNRLEEEKYQPNKVFLTEVESNDWPGDTEGRTILGLVMDAKASGREPKYLDEIIRRIPEHLNSQGYMGTIHPGIMHEQQLSGNGWMLRGLCEYYLWKNDDSVLDIIKSISYNLFAAGKGNYANYPIKPEDRDKNIGDASGSTSSQIGNWALCSDIGCVFIGMEGFIQAYSILKDESLKPIVEEMIDRFLQIDLIGIKAQTHASLTACRGLMRYYGITGNKKYAEEALKRWDLYKQYGMTEHFANYNWFRRYDTWTEPCAIVDSYLLAYQLWEYTKDSKFLDDAELIYYNALCRAQRENGGFGLDNCPGLASGTDNVGVHTYEAHWCCTMRGGEGLGRAAEYAFKLDGNKLYVPFYQSGTYKYDQGGKQLIIEEESEYPAKGRVSFSIKQNSFGKKIKLLIPVRPWMEDVVLFKNGKTLKISNPQDGFITIKSRLKKGDAVQMTFTNQEGKWPTLNSENTLPNSYKKHVGSVLLDENNKPIYLDYSFPRRVIFHD